MPLNDYEEGIKMFWAVLIGAIIFGTVVAIVAYKKGYKHGYADARRADIDYC